MRFRRLLALVLIASAVVASPAAGRDAVRTTGAPLPDSASVGEAFRSSPVMFIENVGQFDPAARFQVRGAAGTMWLAEDAIWIMLVEQTGNAGAQRSKGAEENAPLPLRASAPLPRKGVNLKLTFPSANPHPRLEPFDRLDTKVSYFLGNDPEKWRPDVPVWGGVRYADILPGADLELTGENGQWSWRLVVRTPSSSQGESWGQGLRLQVAGADSLLLDGDLLRLSTAVGEYTLPLLKVAGPVDTALAHLTIEDNQVVSPFTRNSYSPVPNLPPAISNPQSNGLLYATFLGGIDQDWSDDIVVDGAGQAYVTGDTYSADFPVGPGYDTRHNGYEDAFVVKLNAAGTALLYATFLGGSRNDGSSGIAVDGAGQAYVTGYTGSADFPAGPGYDTRYNGYTSDAFVVKLNAAGTALLYAIFLGGSEGDGGSGIAVDGAGQVYVTGWTDSADFPTGPGSDTSFNGGYQDAFVAKLAVSPVLHRAAYLPAIHASLSADPCLRYEPNDTLSTAWGPLATGQAIGAALCSGDPDDYCRRGAYVAFVNDNVRYGGEIIPVDLFTTNLAEDLGFEPVKVYVLPQRKGNSSQQMEKFGREALRKSTTVWRKP